MATGSVRWQADHGPGAAHARTEGNTPFLDSGTAECQVHLTNKHVLLRSFTGCVAHCHLVGSLPLGWRNPAPLPSPWAWLTAVWGLLAWKPALCLQLTVLLTTLPPP